MGRRVRHFNPRDADAVVALDTRFATSNVLPNRAPASGITPYVIGSPTYSAGGQGGQPRLITGTHAGLTSDVLTPTDLFPVNKIINVAVWRYHSSGNLYMFYIGTLAAGGFTAGYSGLGGEGNLIADWGGPGTAGRTNVATSMLAGTTAIRSHVFTGSSASLRQNGVQLQSRTHSTAVSNNPNHRFLINGYSSNGTTGFSGSNDKANEFYAGCFVRSDSVPLTKRIEQHYAFSFKIDIS